MADEGEGAAGTPNATLYVNNLPERIKGDKLRNGLKKVFGPYGKVGGWVCGEI